MPKSPANTIGEVRRIASECYYYADLPLSRQLNYAGRERSVRIKIDPTITRPHQLGLTETAFTKFGRAGDLTKKSSLAKVCSSAAVR